MCESVWTDVDGRRTCRQAPVCRDYLRGACRRSSLCKFRHVSLDQYTSEVHDIAVHGHHRKRRHQRDDDDDEDDAVRCCCKTQDRLRVLQAENASLRKRVADLRHKVAQLSSQHKQSAHSDFSNFT